MLSGYLADMATGLVLVEQLRLESFFQRAGTGGHWTLGLRKEEDWELGVEVVDGVWHRNLAPTPHPYHHLTTL
ncbi:hypothetical protein CesoFtcFv8_020664 [Champsocephalus esox]|uniref:Uncharacterized protein n=2 Tax=Champsocephalus TaxID=52236 RepID=A0AAN8CQU2_CHAGU|nr:hypothetical protein CesoFtcFv8_020664 [Champsocephalus esox]KAK5908114.1 hypothetical protein CgunFtcFv8_016199 [Champsocephalus gunnari]